MATHRSASRMPGTRPLRQQGIGQESDESVQEYEAVILQENEQGQRNPGVMEQQFV